MEKEKNTKTLITLMIICVCLSIVTLGLVIYDRFIRKEPEHAVLKPITIDNNQIDNTKESKCPKCESSAVSNLGEKVSSVKKMTITETNQNFKVGSKTFQIRKDDVALYVNNKKLDNEVFANFVYVTDKFAIITSESQYANYIAYALNEDGWIVVNSNGYNLDENNFKVVDGYLYAKGYEEGYDDKNQEMVYHSIDVIIKYIDNTLIVTKFK